MADSASSVTRGPDRGRLPDGLRGSPDLRARRRAL